MSSSVSAGETLHEVGKDGVRRAKVWLEKTGRVDVRFSRYEVSEAPFLTFTRDDGQEFSFDIGGVLRLDDGNVSFRGEVKKVAGEASQGTMYHEYLAKCYRASSHHQQPYHFMWITWHPFKVTRWSKLCTAEEIESAVSEYGDKYCGSDVVDKDLCADLADRLWLIVLSDRQENLSMSDAMLGYVMRALTEGVSP